MYEHTSKTVKETAGLHRSEEEKRIRKFASMYDLEYSTISELRSEGSLTCGLFYHPTAKFIILAFKGTTSEEFREWVTDFSFTQRTSLAVNSKIL